MTSIQDFFQLGMARFIPALVEPPQGLAINLGAGNKHIPGTVALDLPEWDADTEPIPYGDEIVACIHAYHFLEHVEDPIDMLREMQRVLVPGGVANIVVPYYNSQMQHQDLHHKNWFCEETWRVTFANPYYSQDGAGWRLRVGLNIIIGAVERNLCLMTQLIKEEG